MEVYERIRALRKHLKMSMEAFGDRLGVSRDVINNIEHNRLARPDQKLSLIKLMCKEFSVNEDWLLNGNEPMITQPDSFSLDRFAKEHGCTELELEILKAYFELDQETRLAVVNHFKKRLTSADRPAVPTLAPTPHPVESEPAPPLDLAKELAELKRQLAAEKARADRAETEAREARAEAKARTDELLEVYREEETAATEGRKELPVGQPERSSSRSR